MYSFSKTNILQAIIKITIFLSLTAALQLSTNPDKLTLGDDRKIRIFINQTSIAIMTNKTLAELITYLTIAHLHHFEIGKDGLFIEKWKSAIFSKINDEIELKKRIAPRADIIHYQVLALNILKEHLNKWKARKRKLTEKQKILNAHSRRSPSE
jgi:hypothetical protein